MPGFGMGGIASRHASAYCLALISVVVAGVGGLLDQAAFAGGRIVVVGPNQGPQPLGSNESVKGGKTVIINGQPVTIVQVEQMPPKPKFVLCLNIPRLTPPGGTTCAYFPFPPDQDMDGVHISWEHEPAPGGGTRVFKRRSIGANHVDDKGATFPPGSVLIPDPPQPPGLTFMADRYPADPPTESAVLAALGLPDNPWPEVWVLTTGDMYFYTDSNPPGPPVHFNTPIQPGDLNCDGAVDTLDIARFVQALIDPAGYAATYPDCGYFYADVNTDIAVNGLDIDSFVTLLMGP